jgi:protein-tyrosine phosphatase
MKVLMVCLGNICRSPLAEGILRHKITAAGLPWEVDSAGTGDWHSGSPPDQRSIEVAQMRGVDISAQRARVIKKEDLDIFDHILVMDMNNYRNVLQMSQRTEHRNKVKLIMDYEAPGQSIKVPDPYHENLEAFRQVYDMLDRACDAFIGRYKPAE